MVESPSKAVKHWLFGLGSQAGQQTQASVFDNLG